MIIILHRSGATFVVGASASTWLGAVQIERGWMIGVFLHLWFFATFFLQWQKEGANSFSKYKSWNAELLHQHLLRSNQDFIILLKRSVADSSLLPNDVITQTSDELIDKFRSGGYAAREHHGEIRVLPTISRDFLFNYSVDFSKPSLISGSSSTITQSTIPLDQFPQIALPNEYNWKMLSFELTGTLYILTHKLDWYKRFLHWTLAWFACLSIFLTLIGLL
jgi:hypothetical protein